MVSAPSGAGKTTLCREAMKKLKGVAFSISYTTRPARPGEREGVDYRFVKEETFLEMVEKGEIAEWARVYDHLYGTPLPPLNQAIEKGEDLFLDIDIQGASQIKAKFPDDTVAIYVFPPSLKTLRERLTHRDTDPTPEIKKRWEKAEEEIAMYPFFHYFIVNDNLEEAVEYLANIVNAERHRINRIQELKW